MYFTFLDTVQCLLPLFLQFSCVCSTYNSIPGDLHFQSGMLNVIFRSCAVTLFETIFSCSIFNISCKTYFLLFLACGDQQLDMFAIDVACAFYQHPSPLSRSIDSLLLKTFEGREGGSFFSPVYLPCISHLHPLMYLDRLLCQVRDLCCYIAHTVSFQDTYSQHYLMVIIFMIFHLLPLPVESI